MKESNHQQEQPQLGLDFSKFISQGNPIEQVQFRFKEIEHGFKSWLSQQSLPVEAAIVTATSSLQGAGIGAIMGTLTNDMSSSLTPPPQANLNPQAMASFKQAQALSGGPLVQARNFAIMTGVNAGISCVMKRLRGKEDVQSSMVAAFGSGAIFSLVSGVSGPNQVANAVGSGLLFAFAQGGLYKSVKGLLLDTANDKKFTMDAPLLCTISLIGASVVQLGQKFSQPPEEDVYYTKAKQMLKGLGLEKYEKNFRKGLLTDNTLPLLTDSALRDVRIPPGPRLLILDQIHRDPELKGSKKK